MKNSLTLKMKGKEGAKTLPTLRKRSVWKQKRKRRKRKRKVRLEALPAAWNFAWCVLSYRSTMSFFFFFLISRGKRRGKSKRGKTRTQRVSPVSLGLAINWLPLYFLVHSPDGLLYNLWGWKGDVAAGMALSWGEVCIGRTAHLIKCCESPQRKGLKNTVYSVHY